MRYGTNAKQPKKKTGKIFLFLFAASAIVYIFAATAAGSWIADHVAKPIFAVFSPSATQPAATSQISSGEKITEKITVREKTYYAVQVGVFTDENNAKETAKDISNRGAAGYVYKDGEKFRVIAAVYQNKEDAQSVKSNLIASGMTAAVYEAKAAELSFSITASEEQISVVKDIFSGAAEIVDEMISIAIASDNGENVESRIESLIKKTDALYKNFEKIKQEGKIFEKTENVLSALKKYANDINSKKDIKQSGKFSSSSTQAAFEYVNFIKEMKAE